MELASISKFCWFFSDFHLRLPVDDFRLVGIGLSSRAFVALLAPLFRIMNFHAKLISHVLTLKPVSIEHSLQNVQNSEKKDDEILAVVSQHADEVCR